MDVTINSWERRKIYSNSFFFGRQKTAVVFLLDKGEGVSNKRGKGVIQQMWLTTFVG